jgi:hypothetical protein
VRHWVSDSDATGRAAHERLAAAVERLRRRGVDARGEVGDAEPLRAIEGALVEFEAEEILLSSHPRGRWHWLEKDLVGRAQEQFEQPVTHLMSGYGLESAAS